MEPAKIEQDVSSRIAGAGGDLDKLAESFNARYATKFAARDLSDEGLAKRFAPADDEDPSPTPSLKDFLLSQARGFFRRELTDLEQFILIQIFDNSWKDHLYAMDMLKAGIGLQAFAEQDPRVMYKKEGFGFFEQMMSGIRDKVTDLIFRAKVVGQTQSRSAYRETSAVHETTDDYGVRENLAATREIGRTEPVAVNRQEESEGEGETAVKVRQIVNAAPKVGRNDLCPCGSGKKYKKCCGVGVA
jgi:preprotein translocase subunit SecA